MLIESPNSRHVSRMTIDFASALEKKKWLTFYDVYVLSAKNTSHRRRDEVKSKVLNFYQNNFHINNDWQHYATEKSFTLDVIRKVNSLLGAVRVHFFVHVLVFTISYFYANFVASRSFLSRSTYAFTEYRYEKSITRAIFHQGFYTYLPQIRVRRKSWLVWLFVDRVALGSSYGERWFFVTGEKYSYLGVSIAYNHTSVIRFLVFILR